MIEVKERRKEGEEKVWVGGGSAALYFRQMSMSVIITSQLIVWCSENLHDLEVSNSMERKVGGRRKG